MKEERLLTPTYKALDVELTQTVSLIESPLLFSLTVT